jgi:hypothetical protein
MALKIALQIAPVLVTVLVANLDYVWHDKRTRKFRRTRLLLYVLSGVMLILGVVATIRDEDQQCFVSQSYPKGNFKTVHMK